MEGSVRDRRGGIRGLARLLGEHGEAIEYDLIRLGLRLSWLGTRRLTWRDLYVIVRQSPQDSAIHRATAGADHIWDLHGHLLAGIFDVLSVANWQRAGDENAKRPERLPRPGVVKQVEGETLARGKAVSIEEMNARLGW